MSQKERSTKDIRVRLTGEDGNVFSIVGRVKSALRQAGFNDEADEFVRTAFGAGSYDEVLMLCMETVTVL